MEVVARRGGLGQAVILVLTLGLIISAFVVGLVFGAVAALAPQQGTGLPLESVVREGNGDDRIAVIAVEGAIDGQASDEVARAVAHVLADSRFKSVVLRVDSPGGAVSPSDRIWRDIERLRTAGLPVVASYGGVAASGGVYISCSADHIVCEPTGMTGSVGVIASVLTFEGLMEKVGVQPVTIVASGSPKKDDANDLYRTWDSSDRAVVQGMLDRSYNIFVDRVMTGRTGKASDPNELRASLDGRVFGAEEAKSIGLIDSIGYLDDAIAEAERQAGLAAASAVVVRLFEPAPFFGNGLLGVRANGTATAAGDGGPLDVLAGFVGSRQAGVASPGSASTERDLDRVRSLMTELARPRIEYRLHY